MKDIQKSLGEIVEYIGGMENIANATHCMTRLRLVLKDESLEEKEKLEKVEGVIKVVHAGGQVQVVIGQQVSKVYDELCKMGGFNKTESIEDEPERKKEKLTIKSVANNIMSTLSGCIIPTLPIMIVAGIFKMLVILFGPEQLGWLAEDSDLIVLFEMVGNAGYYFLPFYAAYSSAVKFKVSPMMALLFSGIMLSPNMLGIVEAQKAFTVFGIPMHLTSYVQAVIPIIIIVWIMSYVEKFLKKYIPDMLRIIGVPVLTIVIMLPIGLCILGPACYIIMGWVADGLLWLTANFGLLAAVIVAPLWPFVVLFGMHVPVLTALLPAQMEIGYDMIVYPAMIVGTFTYMGLFLAYALRAKGAEKKSVGWSCFTSMTLANISEPGLYGIILADRKALIYSMIANACGSLVCYLLQAKVYIFAGVGFPFLNPLRFGEDIVKGTIGCLVGLVVALAIGIIFGFQGEDKLNIGKKKLKFEKKKSMYK
ncbi:PTS transporter subunit EIIC [Allocoprobacillus halotolerans]|uniref:PTS transporter subunit EIIC n=1 Tax=Allocoprobacillus halotolerans TaxID=2944914 RepID=A0ABY5I8F8_9FIRM|nr:PTS transporter subunit EIIC [Allocoprobacillus halotolerans]UTY40318.1 PTS transporter subunit EIIC [Allocoprobacillus halotolerans]